MTRLICLIAGNVLGGEVNTSKFSDQLEWEKLTRTAGQPILLLLLAVSVLIEFGIQGLIGGLVVNCNKTVLGEGAGDKIVENKVDETIYMICAFSWHF